MYAVIDIGSNSVRIMFSDGEKTLYKLIKTTKLAEGLAESGVLSKKAICRSIGAVAEFIELAALKYRIKPYIFATEAVRSAANGGVFTAALYEKCRISVDVLSGEEEARLGFVGAYDGGKICVLDIGGASTEIVVGDESGIVYAKSVKIGAVRLRDICGENESALNKYITEKIEEFNDAPKSSDEVVAIGGTASTIAAVQMELAQYNSALIHNHVLTAQDIRDCYEKMRNTSLAERSNIKGLSRGREDIIVGAIYELILIMQLLQTDKIRVSESDNLEGYLKTKILP